MEGKGRNRVVEELQKEGLTRAGKTRKRAPGGGRKATRGEAAYTRVGYRLTPAEEEQIRGAMKEGETLNQAARRLALEACNSRS